MLRAYAKTTQSYFLPPTSIGIMKLAHKGGHKISSEKSSNKNYQNDIGPIYVKNLEMSSILTKAR